MRWALFRRHVAAAPAEDAVVAEAEAHRALRDAKAATSEARYLASHARDVAKSSRAIRERNHVAWAVERSIRGV